MLQALVSVNFQIFLFSDLKKKRISFNRTLEIIVVCLQEVDLIRV